MKYCYLCKEKKAKELFHPDSTRKDLKSSKCKDCHKEYGRKYNIQTRYGIKYEEYKDMLVKQDNVCQICEQECPSGRALAVDHCHTSGKIRGLLCGSCNRALGLVKDNKDILLNMINYLERN